MVRSETMAVRYIRKVTWASPSSFRIIYWDDASNQTQVSVRVPGTSNVEHEMPTLKPIFLIELKRDQNKKKEVNPEDKIS